MKNILCLLLVLCCSCATFTNAVETPQNSFQIIGDAIAPNLSALKQPDAISSPLDIYTTALDILQQGGRDRNALQNAAIGVTTISDLNILFYDVSKPLFTVLKKINRTQTVLGECSLASLLITPTADIEALTNRQNIIRFLVENDELRVAISGTLKNFAKQEEQLLALWNQNDVLYSKNMRQSLFGDKLKKQLNPVSVEAKRRFLDIFEPSSPLLGLLALMFVKKLTSFGDEADESANFWKKHKGKIFNASSYSGTLLGMAIAWKTSWSKFKNRHALRIALKKRFLSLVALGETLTTINTHAKDVKEVSIPALQSIIEFKEKNVDIQQFINSLKNNAFKLERGYWNASMGRLFAAVPRFISLKKRICSVLHALGELDALVGIATLMKEHEGLNNHFCYAEYQPYKGTPLLSVTQFWHPNLAPDVAIPNDILLGGPTTRNMAITGANAAGKSTISKGAMLAALFAQTLTISAAQAIRLTPFTLINTYLNIVEDAGSAVSQHRAEVKRAVELITLIMNLPPDKCALTMMDEMFRCTNPATGASAAHAIGKVLGTVKNSILVLATHYFLLTALAKDPACSFANFCVHAYKQADGKFQYPYLLKPGINSTAIAIDLLAAEGFDKEILTYAREHLQRVESMPSLLNW